MPIFVMGDKIVYAFVYNPRTGFWISGEEPDTVWGVMMLDPRNGEETLLVSSRRQTQLDPLDGPIPWNSPDPTQRLEYMRQLSESQFYLRGYVCDIRTRQWTKADANVEKVVQEANDRERWIPTSGANWSPIFQNGSLIFDGHGPLAKGKPWVRVTLPMKFEFTGKNIDLSDWPALEDCITNRPDLISGGWVRLTENYVILSNWFGFYLIPKDELAEVLEAAIANGQIEYP